MTNPADLIGDYLVTAIQDAVERNDTETIYRASRALIALDAPLSMDIFVEGLFDIMQNDMKVIPISWLKQ